MYGEWKESNPEINVRDAHETAFEIWYRKRMLRL